MPAPLVAPWTRTRLRAAPAPAAALALLVCVTAFLAAVFPRAVDTYEGKGVRAAITDAGPARSSVELAAPAPGLEVSRAEREQAVRDSVLRGKFREVASAMPEPIRVDGTQSAYGVRTVRPPEGLDPSLPRPDSIAPQFTLAAQAGVAAHARVRDGRLPRSDGTTVTAESRRIEAAVTADTARVMRLKAGSAVHIGTLTGERVTVRITGIVEPSRPKAAYWSHDPVLRTPSLIDVPGANSQEPQKRWHAALLLASGAGAFLPAVDQVPQQYWRIAPDFTALTARELPALKRGIASLEAGPLRTELRGRTGPDALVSTDLDKVVTGYDGLRDAVSPIVAVAAYGVGGVAAVVLLMTCSLTAVRRHEELALLRSRGGSVRGVAGRLLAETSVVAVPAAALGLLGAVLLVPDARLWPSVLAAVVVGVVGCAALPVRAAFTHRRPRAHEGRDDLLTARPSRRRTVAELVLFVLAVGAVVTLRRDSSLGGGLVSAAPLLVGGIAALLLVRLYPLPLRLFLRPLARSRGALGFLSMASAGRASATQALPLLGLLLALTTAAFGGSVLAGVADARDRTALLAVGADVRVERGDGALPGSLAAEVRRAPGVGEVTSVHVDWYLRLPDQSTVPLVAVDPAAYSRLTRSTGLGPVGEAELAAGDDPRGTLPAVASPDVARRLGKGAHSFRTPTGSFRAAVGAVRENTPALPAGSAFLLIDRRHLESPPSTALLATAASGQRIDTAALERAAGTGVEVRSRAAERAALTDSPLQSGAERCYAAAVAAGAGYAVLAVLLALLHSAPRRAALLARLRTLGLSTGQGRRLLVLESLPQALLAACGGAVAGWAAIALLAPGIDLARIALTGPGRPVSGLGAVTLRADPWSLLLPAAGVVVLTAGVAFVQAWWTTRRRARWTTRRQTSTQLRTGETP
ncbi:FtsX-like permease family protein [Streptomyces sp. NPDC050658]|uniref:FtsX-like permease family protein n=1 Tax=unclassified Streptomyces TaxID=2593676 RepID=UPI003440E717